MTSLKQAVALLGVLAVGTLAPAAGAGAADGFDPGGEPLPSAPLPNLVVSAASVVPFGTSQWQIRYTVSNRGTTPSPGFHVAVQQDGIGLIKDAAHALLNAGASRSEEILVTGTSCYIAVRAVADSTRVVTELREFDNQRSAVGLTSVNCSAVPKYTVKAVSFHAVDESGSDWLGSDEPYWIFNSVGLDQTQRSTVSRVFGAIDTGDTATFSSSEGCLYVSCDGGAAPYGIGFSVELWEHDFGDIPRILSMSALSFYAVGALLNQSDATRWAGSAATLMGDALKAGLTAVWADDLIGTQTYAYDPAYLGAMLPAVGATFNDTRTYSGGSSSGGAVYTLTVAVMRVA